MPNPSEYHNIRRQAFETLHGDYIRTGTRIQQYESIRETMRELYDLFLLVSPEMDPVGVDDVKWVYQLLNARMAALEPFVLDRQRQEDE